MRVLLVTDFFPPVRGGLEFHVDLLAAELAARGHDVHVATVTPAPVPMSPAVKAHVVAPLYPSFLRFADPQRPFHPPLPDPKAVAELRRLARRIRPDLVHAHNLLGLSARLHQRIPHVYTAHDYGLICQRRTLLYQATQLCGGPQWRKCVSCGASDSSLSRSAAMASATVLARRSLPADVVLAVSDRVRDELARHIDSAIEVVPGFIPPAVAEPLPVPGLPVGPYVMYAGDPGAHKGVDLLLEIWAGPDAPALPLVVAATKPVAVATPGNVCVVQLDRAQTLAAFASAALAVVPSKWHEPYPTVAMEALAAGTPVVASNIGGLPDIVRHEVDGLLVPPGDASALRCALSALIGDEDRRRDMAAAARRGSQRFLASAVVPRLEAVYERLLATRAAA